jgi:hypothetical protein
MKTSEESLDETAVANGPSVENIDNSIDYPNSLESSGTICLACERKRLGGKPYKHGHAPFCSKSIYYGLNEEQISALKEERSNKLKDTKENVLRRMGLSVKDTELKFPDSSSVYPKICDIPANLTSSHLSELVQLNETPNSKAPKAVIIILRYLQLLAPSLKKGTNEVIDQEDNQRKLEFYREVFPRGTISFTVPKEDPIQIPHPDYRIAEDCRLFLVRWELQTSDDLKCPHCQDGTLVYKKVGMTRAAVRLVLDLEGKPAWAAGSIYRCVNCEASVHATDPELLQTLPTWMQHAYPVDFTWINKAKSFQIGRRLGALIETLFINEGYDSHFVSYFLKKLYDMRYRRDFKLMQEAFEMHGQNGPSRDEWTFDHWTGDFTFPVGDFLREALDFARTNAGYPSLRTPWRRQDRRSAAAALVSSRPSTGTLPVKNENENEDEKEPPNKQPRTESPTLSQHVSLDHPQTSLAPSSPSGVVVISSPHISPVFTSAQVWTETSYVPDSKFPVQFSSPSHGPQSPQFPPDYGLDVSEQMLDRTNSLSKSIPSHLPLDANNETEDPKNDTIEV